MPRKAIVYKPEEINFVRVNMGSMPLRKISAILSIPLASVCDLKKRIESEQNQKPKIKRPPCEYQNRSREQVMDYYLNLAI